MPNVPAAGVANHWMDFRSVGEERLEDRRKKLDRYYNGSGP